MRKGVTVMEQATPQNQDVNSIKLTKLEKKVLTALLELKPQEEYCPKEGNNIEGIASIVYGEEVFGCERRGGHACVDLSVCYAAKSSLSRALKSLWKKGLVKKCKPIYESYWVKGNESGVGFYNRELVHLRAVSIDFDRYRIEEISVKHLPDRTHVWWLLTEKGIKYAKEGLAETKPWLPYVMEPLKIDAQIGKEARKIGLPRPSEKGASVKISHLEQISRLEDEDKPESLAKPEACQPIVCQSCKAGLLVVHQSDGRHRLLLKGRKP